eukprot:symbB.v1.2.002832.t1/scaffold144.1/size299099/10
MDLVKFIVFLDQAIKKWVAKVDMTHHTSRLAHRAAKFGRMEVNFPSFLFFSADLIPMESQYGDLSSEERVEFPAFRSQQWIKSDFDKLRCPSVMLEGVDLQPAFMTNFPSVNLYPGKVKQVREQIRFALFRQAWGL